MGGTRVDAGTGTANDNSKEEIVVTREEIAETMREIFGEGGGLELRDAPWQLLNKATTFIFLKNVVMILKVFEVHFKRGNLTAIKLLFDLLEQFAKHGSVQPAQMQSFADVLIKSLEAEKGSWTMVAVEPDSGPDSGSGSEAGSEVGSEVGLGSGPKADSEAGVEAGSEVELEAGK